LSNKDTIKNKVSQEFNNRDKMEAVVRDLTYVKVGGKWNHICVIVDLYSKKIVGYSISQSKDEKLAYKSNIKYKL